MAEYFYTTVENQQRPDGSFGLLYDHYIGTDPTSGYTAEQRAWAKFYTVAAAAIVSDIPYHSITLFRSDGAVLDMKIYDRRAAAVTED